MKNCRVELTARGGNFSRGENPVKLLQGICDFAIYICNSSDATHLLT